MATSSVLEGNYKKEEEGKIMVKKKPLMEGHEIHKRRNHSAIRNYPSGCGRFTTMLQQRSDTETCDDKEEEQETKVRKRKPLMRSEVLRKRHKYRFAVRDYPPGCCRFIVPKQDIIAKLQHSEICGDKKSSVLDGCCSEDEDEEEEEEEEIVRERKILMGTGIFRKRRKFSSAIRDYPPGCGRFAVSSNT